MAPLADAVLDDELRKLNLRHTNVACLRHVSLLLTDFAPPAYRPRCRLA